MRPLTIVHLAANRWWTGSADPVIQLARGLEARGHRVLLGIVPGDRFEEKAREAGLTLVAGVRLDTSLAPRVALADLGVLRRLVRAERVDVVHAHHSHDHWLAWLAAGAQRRDGARVPVVRTFHNARSVGRGVLARWLYRRTAAMLTVSRSIEARCRALGVPADRIATLPGVVDLSRFSPAVDGAPIREELKLDRAPVVVSVARLAPSRRHDLLITAFKLVLRDVPDARLVLVGKGEMRARLESRVAAAGRGARLRVAGERRQDLPVVLAAADCFALMAAGSDESCRAALEAMAAGRAVVARPVGALPETIVDGETGLLVGDDAPEAIAAALAGVLRDRVRARTMGEAGRRRAEALFGRERLVDVVERVYESLT